MEADLYGIACNGSRELLAALECSLRRLYLQYLEGFRVASLVRRIVEADRSRVRPEENPPTFSLARLTAFHSVTWLASCLVHEGHHVALFQHARIRGENVPEWVWSGSEAELKCLSIQLEASRRIHAPPRENRHIESQNRMHYLRNRYW